MHQERLKAARGQEQSTVLAHLDTFDIGLIYIGAQQGGQQQVATDGHTACIGAHFFSQIGHVAGKANCTELQAADRASSLAQQLHHYALAQLTLIQDWIRFQQAIDKRFTGLRIESAHAFRSPRGRVGAHFIHAAFIPVVHHGAPVIRQSDLTGVVVTMHARQDCATPCMPHQ